MHKIAAVTGATGMVGKNIVNLLIEKGYHVRILTRNKNYKDQRVQIILGDLLNQEAIKSLLVGASAVFHCAAELKNTDKMQAVNVEGTKILMSHLECLDLEYICHLSSVGVIGYFKGNLADELTPCSPMNTYEKTKLEAEKIVHNLKTKAKVIILRPTNVIDRKNHPFNERLSLKRILKGGENSHVIHAFDVASAALYFLDSPSPISPNTFIVSIDYDPMNTYSGCNSICQEIKNKNIFVSLSSRLHLPWIFPYTLRRITKGKCNFSNIRYSSDKLLGSGFKYPLGLLGALKDICWNQD